MMLSPRTPRITSVKDGGSYTGPRGLAFKVFGENPPKRKLSAKEAVRYIIDNYPNEALSIQEVAPYEFVWWGKGHGRSAGAPPTVDILVVWCNFSAASRDGLFAAAPDVVRNTGWYPMVTGSYMYLQKRWIENTIKQVLPTEETASQLELGQFLSLSSVLPGNMGTSFYLKTSECGVLLDCGLKWSVDVNDKLNDRCLMILSHSHSDHCGGLIDAYRQLRPQAVFMSPVTLRLLGAKLVSEGKGQDFKEIASHTILLAFNESFTFHDGSTISFLDANHMPGAVMVIVRTSDNVRLFYSGDCCVDNFYGHIMPLRTKLKSLIGKENVELTLFDATLVGRKFTPSAQQEETKLLELLTRANASARCSTILTDNYDVAVRIYTVIYETFMQGSAKVHNLGVYLDLEIFEFMNWVASAYVRRELENLDPILRRLCAARKNPFENVLLYANGYDEQTMKNITYHLERRRPIILMLDAENLPRLAGMFNAIRFELAPEDQIIALGRAAERLKDVQKAMCLSRAAAREMPGDRWSLHSSESALDDFLRSSRESLGKVFLFHNFPKRVEPFCLALSSDFRPVPFTPAILHDLGSDTQ